MPQTDKQRRAGRYLDHSRRTAVLGARVTPEDRELVGRAAEQADTSISAFVANAAVERAEAALDASDGDGRSPEATE